MKESSPVMMIEVSDERTRPWGYSSAATMISWPDRVTHGSRSQMMGF